MKKTDGPPGEVSIRFLAALALLCLVPILIFASPPGWWSTRNVTTGGTANDYAAANQGQLKNIATAAFNELGANLPGGVGDMTAPSGTFPGGTGYQLTALINSWSDTTSGTWAEITGSNTNDYAAVNLGQLKHVSRLFYKRLIEAGFASYYPWESTGNPPNDYGVANIGQVKNLFSFDVTTASDSDGVPDMWELNNFGTIGISGTSLVPSGNGLTVYQSYEDGVNPIDYYNNVPPTITIVNGNDQTGAPGALLSGSLVVQVTGTSGTPLVNAPVNFAVTQGNGVLAPDNSGTSATSSFLQVRTGTGGYAQVYFQQPSYPAFTSAITAYADESGTCFNEVTSSSTTPPVAPSDVTADVWPNGSVVVNWTDSSENESDFTIQTSTDGGGTWVTTGTVPAGANLYVIPPSVGVNPGDLINVAAECGSGTTNSGSIPAILPVPSIRYAMMNISGTNTITSTGTAPVLSMALTGSGQATYCFASGTFPVAVGSGSANGGFNQITVNTWISGTTTSGTISADSPAQSITEAGTAAYPGLRDESLSADNSLYQNASGSGGDYDFDWIETPYILNSPPPSVIVTPDGNAYGTAVEACYFPYVVNPADTREWPPIVVNNAFFWSGSTQQKQTREFTDPSFTTGTANLIVNNYGLADYELDESWIGSPLGSMVLACSQAGYCGVGLFGVPDPYLSESDQNWYVENGGTFNDLFAASYICTTSGTTIFYDPDQWDNEFLAGFSPWESAGITAIATAFTPSAMNDNGYAIGGQYYWNGTSLNSLSDSTAVGTALNNQNMGIGYDTASGTTGMLWLLGSGSSTPITMQSLAANTPYKNEIQNLIPTAISGTDSSGTVAILCSCSVLQGSGTAAAWQPATVNIQVNASAPSGTSTPTEVNVLRMPPASYAVKPHIQCDGVTLDAVGTGTDEAIPSADVWVPAQFKLRTDKDLFKGWDPTETADFSGTTATGTVGPWTSVAVGGTNSYIKVDVSDTGLNMNDLELVVAPDSSTTYVNVLNVVRSGRELTFDIKGLADSTTDATIDPKIILRRKDQPDKILATLNVRVLPVRYIYFDVFYASDPDNPNTIFPLSIPLPTPKKIQDNLNEAFYHQANVIFLFNHAWPLDCPKSVFLPNGSVPADPSVNKAMYEESLKIDPVTTNYRVVVVKTIADAGVWGITDRGVKYNCSVIGLVAAAGSIDPPAGTSIDPLKHYVFAHEGGRVLHIPSIHKPGYYFDTSRAPIEEFEDDGLSLIPQLPLMGDEGEFLTPWIRQQDWLKANVNANNAPFK